MINILIVEDELIIAEDMSNILEKIGYKITGIAIDYNEAISSISREVPDLILMDINLSGSKDGIELAGYINENFQIPIIFTTSYTDNETLNRAKLVNPVNYLVKPFQKEQLYSAIEIGLANFAKSDNIEQRIATNKDRIYETTEDDENSTLFIKDALFIKDKFKYTKLSLKDILWIKSDGNYLEIHTSNRVEVIRATMSGFIEKLNINTFFRTHKSYIVNLDYLTKFETPYVTIVDTKIPISRTFADDLLKRLKIM